MRIGIDCDGVLRDFIPDLIDGIKEGSFIDKETASMFFKQEFDELLPKIQEQWPDLAKQTLEATKGSLDEMVRVISQHSGTISILLFTKQHHTTFTRRDSLVPIKAKKFLYFYINLLKQD